MQSCYLSQVSSAISSARNCSCACVLFSFVSIVKQIPIVVILKANIIQIVAQAHEGITLLTSCIVTLSLPAVTTPFTIPFVEYNTRILEDWCSICMKCIEEMDKRDAR